MMAQQPPPAREAATQCPGSGRKCKRHRESKEKGDKARQGKELSGTDTRQRPATLPDRFLGHKHLDLASEGAGCQEGIRIVAS